MVLNIGWCNIVSKFYTDKTLRKKYLFSFIDSYKSSYDVVKINDNSLLIFLEQCDIYIR